MANKEEIKLHVFPSKVDISSKKIHAAINNVDIHKALGDRWKGKSWIVLGETQPSLLNPDVDADVASLSTLYLQGRLYPVKPRKTGNVTVDIGGEEYEVIDGEDNDAMESPVTFTFKVNPSNISIQKRKLFTKLRTKGGFVFQHWGPDISEISIAGTTGNIRPNRFRLDRKTLPEGIPWVGGREIPVPIPPSDQFADRENSPLLDVFRRLEEVYNQDQDEQSVRANRVLSLEYRQRLYVGHLSEFSFEERAERPFQFYYKFTFLVHYEATSPTAVTSSIAMNIVRNEETLQRIKEIKDESNLAAETGIED